MLDIIKKNYYFKILINILINIKSTFLNIILYFSFCSKLIFICIFIFFYLYYTLHIDNINTLFGIIKSTQFGDEFFYKAEEFKSNNQYDNINKLSDINKSTQSNEEILNRLKEFKSENQEKNNNNHEWSTMDIIFITVILLQIISVGITIYDPEFSLWDLFFSDESDSSSSSSSSSSSNSSSPYNSDDEDYGYDDIPDLKITTKYTEKLENAANYFDFTFFHSDYEIAKNLSRINDFISKHDLGEFINLFYDRYKDPNLDRKANAEIFKYIYVNITVRLNDSFFEQLTNENMEKMFHDFMKSSVTDITNRAQNSEEHNYEVLKGIFLSILDIDIKDKIYK